ncbi:hypothetical protein [Halococcus sp. PRR34]|uniref:hypothetical protein n=1 Tax=Halococcus sp. PRR34 TaxID=3020830 RepID=UPI0023622215|nr:hypothetical protein [Halococcus sp. PRR34]
MSVFDDYYSICDLQGCDEKIDTSDDSYQVVRPVDTSILSCDTFCSANCAKISLRREERGDRD